MQVKLRQFTFAAVLAVAIFIAGAKANQANATVLDLPAVSLQNVTTYALEGGFDYLGRPRQPVVGKVIFKRTQVNSDIDNAGLEVFFELGGTASADDYKGLTERSVYFPPNVFEVELLVVPANDRITEPNGETVIFTLLEDQNVHNPHYNLFKKRSITNVAKILIADHQYSPIVDFSVNDQSEVTVNAGEKVMFQLIIGFAQCTNYGGEFGTAGQQIPYTIPMFWTWASFPTQTTQYNVQCVGHMGVQSSDTVTVNVIQ